MVIGIDDAATIGLIRLFNEPAGQEYLVSQGVTADCVNKLHLLGISGCANLLSAIKFAKYYELDEQDVVLTVATDSMEMYQSRLRELAEVEGPFTNLDAAGVYHRFLLGQSVDYVEELTYNGRKRIHNLKYYTWVEQQGKTTDEIQAQWYDDEYWTGIPGQASQIDRLIEEFNGRVGLGSEQ
jgi:hypothetical protein